MFCITLRYRKRVSWIREQINVEDYINHNLKEKKEDTLWTRAERIIDGR